MKHRNIKAFGYPKKVGVWSMESGCGATYMAIGMANYLTEVCHCKTAYVEVGNLGQIQSLAKQRSNDRARFRYHGIWMFPNIPVTALHSIEHEEVDCWLYDGGCSKRRSSYNLQLYTRKFLVCPGSPWKAGRVQSWLERHSKEEKEAYDFLIPEGSIEVKNVLKDEYRIHFYEVPYIKDPFDLTPISIRFFYELFCKKEV